MNLVFPTSRVFHKVLIGQQIEVTLAERWFAIARVAVGHWEKEPGEVGNSFTPIVQTASERILTTGMNPSEETQELVLQLEIAEAEERKEKVSGKSRVGSIVTDEQLALQLHLEELKQSRQILGDDHIAQSNAMDRDATILAQHQDLDEMELADRRLAMSLSSDDPTGGYRTLSSVSRSSKKTKERVASIPSRSNPIGYIKDDCALCMEIIGSKTNLRAQCGHFYDEKCLVSLIERASMDESSFPPRCCRLAIPRESFMPFMTRHLRETFEKASKEFLTRPRDRVYCSNATCSDFLGEGSPDSIARPMRCIECNHSTCSVCREVAHPNTKACRLEEQTAAIQPLVEENRWQKCPECHRVIELTHGCFHITCVCSAQFCYQCSVTWKRCKCPQWEERLLVAEAERRVDAEIDDAIGVPAPNPMHIPMQEELGQPETQVGFQETMNGARTRRIEEMVTQLRDNHACNHTWRTRRGVGTCENCSTHYRRYLLHCRSCYIAVCVPCARNRL